MAAIAESEMRCGVSDAYRELGARLLNYGSAGNVSCRAGDTIFITPTGATCDSVTPDSIVMMDIDGSTHGPGIPSCEWAMHVEIYRCKPEAMAIVHTHSDACVALSCLRQPIPAFHYLIAKFGGNDIRCASYAQFGTPDLAYSAVLALRERSACLLANHGMVCHSGTLPGAVAAAITLETLARQYLIASRSGNPVLLTDAEVSIVRERLELYDQGKRIDQPWMAGLETTVA